MPAVRSDGTALIKIISAGWGSSGWYGPDVLKRDGPRIFKAGQVKMWWDHPTLAEETERPEGSLSNLAGEFISDAHWQDSGPSGPGLYADAKIFGAYRDAVNELAPHIGVSIRASGRTKQGEAEGRKGAIVEELIAAKSVDFVTVPGRGGQIVQMFEARRPAAAGVDARPDNALLSDQEESMTEEQVREAQAQAQAAQTALAEMTAQNARLRETLLLQAAREVARTALGEISMPEVTRQRLVEMLAGDPPVANGELDRTAFQARINEVAQAELQYLSQAAGLGQIRGMGTAAGNDDGAKADERMREAFVRLGLSDASAQVAATGRLW